MSPTTEEEAIRQVLARFIQLRDDKRFDEWIELFTPDGVFGYGPHVFTGREAIKEHVSNLLRDDRGKHLCVNSVIEIAGDRADVSSDVIKIDPDLSAGNGDLPPLTIRTMGRYVDRLIRDDGRWLFASRRVEIAFFPGAPQ